MTTQSAKTLKPAPRKTKAATVDRLLTREKGATIDEIAKATSWLPHSCRAFLTGLRKKGREVTKEERGDGKIAYRIVAAKTPVDGAMPEALA